MTQENNVKAIQQYFAFLTIVIVVAVLVRYPRAITAAFGGFGSSTERIIKAPL